MPEDLYEKTTGNLNYYGTSTTGSEPNMRNELINTLDGSFPEVAKKQTGLLRQMRLDSDGELIPCECVDEITHEPDKDRFCPVCFGEGYMWDEAQITFYRTLEDSDIDNILRDKLYKPGLINHPLVVFYVRYSDTIRKHDKIVELELDDDGSVSDPMTRRAIHKISVVWDYRSDNGKLEYYKVFAHDQDVKYLNAPSYEDV